MPTVVGARAGSERLVRRHHLVDQLQVCRTASADAALERPFDNDVVAVPNGAVVVLTEGSRSLAIEVVEGDAAQRYVRQAFEPFELLASEHLEIFRHEERRAGCGCGGARKHGDSS